MTPKRFKKIESVLKQRQWDLRIILDEVHKGRNLSAILRSADAHGIDTVHCVVPEAGFQYYRGTALGSHKWVNVERHKAILEPITELKQAGYQIIAAHLDDESLDYRQVDYTLPTALVMGKENEGIRDTTAQYIDQTITIPMRGMVESYNVSVACAIILAEAHYQRSKANMYKSRQLPEEVYSRRLFQWCYPDLREFCDQRGYNYPSLNDQGELIDGPGWYKSQANMIN